MLGNVCNGGGESLERARSHMLGLARRVYLVCFVCLVYLVGWVPK